MLNAFLLPLLHFMLLPGNVQQQHHRTLTDVATSYRWISPLVFHKASVYFTFLSYVFTTSSSAPEGEPVRYGVETLVLFILGPVVVLALLSLVSVLACRRFHHGRLQRLQEFDTEQGAIDGLITSNVGDSTLAVRLK